jgi:hypothetical protein
VKIPSPTYTTVTLLQVLTGYTYDQLHTQGKVPVEILNPLEPDKTWDYHAPPYSNANIILPEKDCHPHLPTCDKIPCSSILQPTSSHCTCIPTRKKTGALFIMFHIIKTLLNTSQSST